MGSGLQGLKCLFDFAPHFFDRVEARRLGRQKQHTGSRLFNQGEGFLVLVWSQVVHDHDVTFLQLWNEKS